MMAKKQTGLDVPEKLKLSRQPIIPFEETDMTVAFDRSPEEIARQSALLLGAPEELEALDFIEAALADLGEDIA